MSLSEQLTEYITRDIVAFIMEDEHLDMLDAMHRFYTSETYEKLVDTETGLYRESSGYVYSLYGDERKTGHLINH